MSIEGFATPEGTARYRERMIAASVAHPEHFREGPGGLALSSIGLGTYLGEHDGRGDALYLEAIKAAVHGGCNLLDTAINYRCQRSERVIGQALEALTREQVIQRDEIVVATKGGYIPYDGAPPTDVYAYVQQNFVMPGIISIADVVADCHCMVPSYLRHQIDASLSNLGLSCLDIYYLHNPETQLEVMAEDEFQSRLGAAFRTLEEAVDQGRLRMYGTATWAGYRSRPGSRAYLSLETLVKIETDIGGKDHHFKVIQLPYNLAMPEALAEQTQRIGSATVSLLEAAKALDVYVMSSASILQGRLSRALPAEVQSVLGEETDAQRAIQFVRSTPGIGTALVGMQQATHVRENLALSRKAPLGPTEFAKLFT